MSALREQQKLSGLAERTARDPHVWSGRAMQGDFDETVASGLASMYPAFDWSVVLRAIMDISARAFSLAVRPQRTIWVTRFRMRREDRTSISFSSSRRPWRVNELLANATRLEACRPRRGDCEPARSMRCVRACWRAR